MITKDLIINEIKKINIENFKYDDGSCDNDTFKFYFRLPESIRTHFIYLLENSDDTFSDKECIDDLFAEYWIDKNEYHYYFTFEDETVNVTEYFSCDYLNSLVLNHYLK